MNPDDITIFAETNFRNQRTRFGIKNGDRRRHTYVIGKTGSGKTTLLENMIIQDIKRGKGVAFVDPHGESAEKILNFVPANRINDVIYFNPADLDFPIAFNAIEKVDSEHRHLIASGLVGVFKKLWAETWGPRLEYVLRNCIMALLEYPGSTLLGIMRMLVDKEYRQKVTARISDPVVRAFWTDEFAKYPDKFMAEAVAPIQNKVGQFLTNPLIRNIVGQTKSSINIREAMDTGRIFIVNLSKGKIGEDTSSLLGAMLITRLQLAAMSRVDVPEEERPDFYLYVDEFQNFATESFANILSEARKYRLDLILAHQYITQVPEEVRDAIFGNVGTMITFRVGATDAEFLEKEFSPEFNIDDLVNLGFAQIYLKLMIDGFASRPFSATTLPPISTNEPSSIEKIIKVSRERYGRSRKEVEEKIAKWSGVVEAEAQERMEMGLPPRNNPDRRESGAKAEFSAAKTKSLQPNGKIFVDVCSECGKKVELNFKPDGVRPIFCKECLAKFKSGELIRPVGENRPVVPAAAKEPALKVLPTQTISLSEATRKPPAKFIAAKKLRKEVDLRGLRQVLEETIGPIRQKGTEAVKNAEVPSAPEKELKPGESVELP